MNEEDPRQAADLMRKLSDMSGLKLGRGDGGSPESDGKRGGP